MGAVTVPAVQVNGDHNRNSLVYHSDLNHYPSSLMRIESWSIVDNLMTAAQVMSYLLQELIYAGQWMRQCVASR
jgi:hypothetical protein